MLVMTVIVIFRGVVWSCSQHKIMGDISINLTNLNATVTQLYMENIALFKTMHIMYEFMLPVVTGLGILGNCVSILAFRQPGLRKSSTSVYLIAMLVSDTGFLITLIWPYLEAKGINLTKQPGWCHVIVYLSYVSAFLSVWFVVCITVESYIIICHPTQMKALCTVKRAKVVVVILTSGSLVGYSATAILTASGERTCRNHHNYEAVWRAITYCDTIITLLVPYIVLTVLLTCITSKVLRRLHRRISHKRHKGTHSGAQINERACTDELPNERTNRRRRKLKVPQVRVAKMLFILSTTVFIMSVPSHVTRLNLIVQNMLEVTLTTSITKHFVNNIFLFIYQCSFSIKAFIFLACSTNFRKVFKKKQLACSQYVFVKCCHSSVIPDHV